MRAELGKALAPLWLDIDRNHTDQDEAYQPDPLSSGRRSLKNLALSYLMAAAHPTAEGLALEQYYSARNMTDRMGGLAALVHYSSCADAAKALDHFYEQWQQDPLIMDKWLGPEANTLNLQPLLRTPMAVFSLKHKKP